MQMTRTSVAALGFAAMCTAGMAAQTKETHTTTTTKVEIKGGKDLTVVGCLERRANGDYVVNQIRDSRHLGESRYMLVTDEDLSAHVGERVEIKGKAVVDGDGKVSVESKTRTEIDNGKDQETKTKTEATSGALDVAYLGVKSMKTLAARCS